MELHLHRPRVERLARIVAGAMMLAAATAVLYLDSVSPRSVVVAVVVTILTVPVLSGALRPVAVASRRGLGVVGVVPGETHWFSWVELISVQVSGTVVSFEAVDRAIYQLRMDPKAAAFVGRMATGRASRRVALEQITRP